MAVKTLDDAIKQLAETQIHVALFGVTRHMTVTAAHLLDDGRTRNKLWKELQKGGYLSADTPDVPTQAIMTFKAFEDYLARAVEVDLAPLYTFDAWRDNKAKGNAYVCWDSLNLPQKVAVIGHLRRDPARFTLMAFDRYSDGSKFQTFELGKGGAAFEAMGGWNHAVLAVTDAAVKAKRDDAAKAHYKAECEEQGLNWFLQKTGAFEREEELPIVEKQPMLGGGGGLPRKPQELPTAVPHAIKATKEKIIKLRERLALYEKLEAYAERIGGWPVFLADYDSAITAHVAEQEAAGKLAEGVR